MASTVMKPARNYKLCMNCCDCRRVTVILHMMVDNQRPRLDPLLRKLISMHGMSLLLANQHGTIPAPVSPVLQNVPERKIEINEALTTTSTFKPFEWGT